MFGGIVVGQGRVLAITAAAGAALRLEVDGSVLGRSPRPGDSVSVSGVCLTVVRGAPERLLFDVVGETVRRSTLGELREGDLVNLEPALRLGDEIGGHQVQGHVDAVGTVRSADVRADETWLRVEAPPEVLETLAPKGWVAVDGVSLTVADLDDTTFSVALIPTTLALTSLGRAAPGSRVNLEGDPLGRHVRRQLAALLARLPRQVLPA